jgi:uncharacterized membrane protein
MGYLLLILGLVLFAGGHWVKRLAPDFRANMGDPKGWLILTLAMLAGVVLMIIGYRAAPVVQIWSPPAFFTHINNLLVLIAFWLFALSHMSGTLSARIRHKQLSAIKAWAIAHLLVNGDLASIILFGGMLAWAVASVIIINRQGRDWVRPANPSIVKDILAFVIGIIVMGIVGYIHTLLGYFPYG